MNTFRIFFLFLIFIISTTVLAQSQTKQQDSLFGKGRIKTIDGSKIYFSSITLGQNFHTYKARSSNVTQKVDIARVSKVEVQKGSYALEVGAGLGILGIIGGIIWVESFPITNPGDLGPFDEIIYVGTPVLSALIGALVGSQFKKYKTAYHNPKFGLSTSEMPLDLAMTNDAVILRLNYHF